MHSQLAVLGGGPGGYAAAFIAADAGIDVTIVESDPRLGGTCLLRGCIPSKALLHVARVISEVEELKHDWGVAYCAPRIDIEKVRERKDQVIKRMSTGLKQLAKKRNVTVVNAHGKLLNSTTLVLAGDHSSIPDGNQITFDQLIVATGSTPAIPGSLAIDSDRVMDSTGALELVDVPERLLVIGGSYIGLEMGTVYAQLGSQVSVVELTDNLLPGADPDLVKPLHRRLAKMMELMLGTKVGSLGDRGDQVEVTFEGPGKIGIEHYDRVLVSVGRRPSSRGIGLENTQVQVDQSGFVVCDAQQRTTDSHIFAVGDVAGEPMLAHKASHEAKVAVETLLGKKVAFKPAAIPAVVFTDPEIAWAGLTEADAKRDGVGHEIAIYPWAASGRAQTLGRGEGLTKWLVDPNTNRVLGCGMVGPGAGELIAESVLAIEMGCEVRDITESIHPHPTLSETLKNAGEVYYGSAVEIYKPKRR